MQIGIHYGGKFYEFVPWNGFVTWEVDPWGHWFMSADNGRYVVNTLVTFYFLLVIKALRIILVVGGIIVLLLISV